MGLGVGQRIGDAGARGRRLCGSLRAGWPDSCQREWHQYSQVVGLEIGQGAGNAEGAQKFCPCGGLLTGRDTLASGSADTTINLWDLKSRLEPVILKNVKGGVKTVAFAPDGRTLAANSGNNAIKLWDWKSGQELATLNGHQGDVETIAISQDGRMLASGSADHTIKLWDWRSGKEISTLKGHKRVVIAVAFSPDGRILASSSMG